MTDPASESPTGLSRLIKQALVGDEVIIAKRNKALVRLVPVEDTKPTERRFGGWEDDIWMAGDFDEPLEDFKDLLLPPFVRALSARRIFQRRQRSRASCRIAVVDRTG